MGCALRGVALARLISVGGEDNRIDLENTS